MVSGCVWLQALMGLRAIDAEPLPIGLRTPGATMYVKYPLAMILSETKGHTEPLRCNPHFIARPIIELVQRSIGTANNGGEGSAYIERPASISGLSASNAIEMRAAIPCTTLHQYKPQYSCTHESTSHQIALRVPHTLRDRRLPRAGTLFGNGQREPERLEVAVDERF